MGETLLRRVNVLGIATVVGVMALWELAIRSGVLDFSYLPPPSGVAIGLTELIANGELFGNLRHTLTAALTGWAVAALVGIVVGTVLGLVKPVWNLSMASLEALRALPIVAFVPVAVLLLGFTLRMEMTVAFYAALWPILLHTIAGMRALDNRRTEVGRVMRLSRWAQLWKLRLPAATPLIIVGLRLGLSVALVLTLVAEMVGNPAGMGFALIQAGQALQPGQMFAYVVVIGASGIVLNATLVSVARVVLRGQMAAAGDVA